MAADGAATAMAASDVQAKLDFFLAWLKVNGAQLRGCGIKYCDSTKGHGVFAYDGGDSTDVPYSVKISFEYDDEPDRGANNQAPDRQLVEATSTCVEQETIWVESLIPGIDSCNHDEQGSFDRGKEIRISYGNKGNEELMCLYGFVIDNNPDDYLMVHYPADAIQNIPFSEAKIQLFIDSKQPSASEVQAAFWEACGDSGALQLLVDLLQTKMMDLEEGTGTEDSDVELLRKVRPCEFPAEHMEPENNFSSSETNSSTPHNCTSRNRWSAIVYRWGQKELTRLFLKEAEHALQLALSEAS